MAENEKKVDFLGTYFDKGNILILSRWASIAAWVALIAYAIDWVLSVSIFIIQLQAGLLFEKGDMFFSLTNLVVPYLLRPWPGVVYFFALMGISRLLLVFLDIEDNTRRAARLGK